MKVALIGYGYWAKILEKYIDASKFFNLHCIYSRSIESHPKGTNEFNDTLSKEIEAVFLAVPPIKLVEYSEIFIEKGKHVFCEKPLSSNPEEVRGLYELAITNRVCLYVNYIYLQSPSINYLETNLKKIGKIISFNSDIKQFGKFYGNQNSFEILGCHMLSVYLYLTRVKDLKQAAIEVENLFDGKVMQIKIKEKNCVANFTANLLSPVKERSIQIIGENGILYFSPLSKETVSLFLQHTDATFKLIEEKAFDESNNITFSLQYFENMIKFGDKHMNRYIAIAVSHLLSKTIK